MSNDKDEEGTGAYNPSGGVPSHPADPQYGESDDTEADDTADDSETE